jgi:AcrR family transcriptional regulator
MPRRSATQAAQTRQRIMDEAQRLFARDGFSATSANDIAKAAGVTDGAIFHHFKNKKRLFTEIAVKLHSDLHRQIAGAGGDAQTPIAAFIEGTRRSMALTQLPHNQRIVFIEGPVVLGTEAWRKVDQQLGLRLIEGGLLAIAGRESLPVESLKPMAVLALGIINEITYALIRKEPGVDAEQCLALLARILEMWRQDLPAGVG